MSRPIDPLSNPLVLDQVLGRIQCFKLSSRLGEATVLPYRR
jgi:hypothetical protein